jgi:acetyl esterase/lipase
MHPRLAFLFAALPAIAACEKHGTPRLAQSGSSATTNVASAPTFAERRARHRTKLLVHGPSPQGFADETPPPPARLIHYKSGGLELQAWFALPPGARTGRVPALVFFHGGFALSGEDFESVRPFLDAGFAVMTPMLRGENGNPGEYELYYGELDDARAAVAWARAQDKVDPAQVFAFGHSAGGVLAALISFYPDTGLRLAGSAGGLYDVDVLQRRAPFDPADGEESLLRVPAPNGDQFRVPHYGYIGTEDDFAARGASRAEKLARKAGAPLVVERVRGDHFTSFDSSLLAFLTRARTELARPDQGSAPKTAP